MGAGGSTNPNRHGFLPSTWAKAPPKDVSIHWKEHGHNYPFPDLPDYRKYKVEGNPILETYQKRLAREGLSDPWIRNYAWLVSKHGKNHHFITVPKRFLFGRGIAIGAGLTILTIVVDETFGVRKALIARGW